MITPLPPPPPPDDLRPAWRAAVLAYRRVRQRGELDGPARDAALAAYRELRPQDADAPRQVSRAIAYAATYHTEWFWRGVR